MSGKTIVFDLDRTLYRTVEAVDQMWNVIGHAYPFVNGREEHARQQDFYIYDGDSYAYDFSAHVGSLKLDVERVYGQIRQSELADGRLAFEGVADVVRWAQSVAQVLVLTYGTSEYQQLKASLLPFLQDVDIITTMQSKGDFFRTHPFERAWMIDDKPIAHDLPDNVTFIQVSLEGVEFSRDTSWLSATALSQIPRLIDVNRA